MEPQFVGFDELWTSFAFVGFIRNDDCNNVFLLDGAKLPICASHKSLKVNYACDDDKKEPKPSSRYEARVVDPPLPPPPPPPPPAVGVYVQTSKEIAPPARLPRVPSTSVVSASSGSSDTAATIFPQIDHGRVLAMSRSLDKYVGPEVFVFRFFWGGVVCCVAFCVFFYF